VESPRKEQPSREKRKLRGRRYARVKKGRVVEAKGVLGGKEKGGESPG